MSVKELRDQMGLTQLDVYDKTGVQTRIQSDIENGKRYNYVADNIVKLADFYGVTTDYILGREVTDSNCTTANTLAREVADSNCTTPNTLDREVTDSNCTTTNILGREVTDSN